MTRTGKAASRSARSLAFAVRRERGRRRNRVVLDALGVRVQRRGRGRREQGEGINGLRGESEGDIEGRERMAKRQAAEKKTGITAAKSAAQTAVQEALQVTWTLQGEL